MLSIDYIWGGWFGFSYEIDDNMPHSTADRVMLGTLFTNHEPHSVIYHKETEDNFIVQISFQYLLPIYLCFSKSFQSDFEWKMEKTREAWMHKSVLRLIPDLGD